MQYFTMFMLLVVSFLFEATVKFKQVPNLLAFVPELISAVVLLYVVVAGANSRFQNVSARYWLVFVAIAAVMVCGIFANSEAPGPIFAGIRYYARAIPLFFLPAVFAYTEDNIRSQLKLLLYILLLQLPLAVWERLLVISAGRWSGDSVVGSFEDSSCLSIILISGVCVMTAMYIRGLLPRVKFMLLFFLTLIPTTINETKATLILLPIGLVTTMVVASPPSKRLRVAISACFLLVAFFAIFAPIYDYLERDNPYKVPVSTFFTDPDKFQSYVDRHAVDTGAKHAGRMDGVRIPFNNLMRDPVQSAFGVGIGNASHSTLGQQFTGAYNLIYEKFLLSSLTSFMLEIGMLGTGLVFVLYWLVFRDCLVVARCDGGLLGAFAAAWAGIAAMTVISMPYKTIHAFPSLSYFFWFYSGLVAARRMVLAREPAPDTGSAAVSTADERRRVVKFS